MNISREVLQKGRNSMLVKKSVTSKILEMIRKLKSDADKYEEAYRGFSYFLKLGAIKESESQKKILDLMLFNSSAGDKKTTLADYVARMKDGQKEIFLIIEQNLSLAKSSPHMEAAENMGVEVLYPTETIDEYFFGSVSEYGDYKFNNLAKKSVSRHTEPAELVESFKPLTEWISKFLKGDVASVAISTRLSNSPFVVMSPEHGMSANMMRLAKSQPHMQNDMMAMMAMMQRPVLEINPNHAIVKAMRERVAGNAADKEFKDSVRLLYSAALIRSGYEVKELGVFTNQLFRMVAKTLGAEMSPEKAEKAEDSQLDFDNPEFENRDFDNTNDGLEDHSDGQHSDSLDDSSDAEAHPEPIEAGADEHAHENDSGDELPSDL